VLRVTAVGGVQLLKLANSDLADHLCVCLRASVLPIFTGLT